MVWLFMIFIGLILFCWGVWGGKITYTEIPELERGLGLNPPPL